MMHNLSYVITQVVVSAKIKSVQLCMSVCIVCGNDASRQRYCKMVFNLVFFLPFLYEMNDLEMTSLTLHH